jgi:hypothetical protein
MVILRILLVYTCVPTGVLSSAADVRVGVVAVTCEEGEGEMIYELGDGDDTAIGMELWDGCSPKVSDDSQAFGLERLETAVIGLGGTTPYRCSIGDDRTQERFK